MLNGTCLCEEVTFTAPNTGVATACHCSQCRKQSGHYWASGSAPLEEINISGDVTWYAASDTAMRGFCAKCGSTLFWKAHDEERMSFSLGALDGATNLHLKQHIFVGDKGDYYDIADGVPQRED